MSNKILVGSMLFLNILLFFACVPSEEKLSADPALTLQFSEDTLTFDTLYSEIKSTTKRLKVYNPSEHAILINSIRFKETNTNFQLHLFGEQAQEFQNITLYGKDSVMLLLDATLEKNDQDELLLIENHLQFSFNTKIQELPVQAWKQEVYIIGTNDQETTLDNETHWTAERPYILRGDILTQRLLVDAGATILMDNNASLHINENLQFLGSIEDTILVQSIRQDGSYENAPNQWNGIFLSENSGNHIIQNTFIKNGRVGLSYIGNAHENAQLEIRNSMIANMEEVALVGIASHLKVINSIIYNAQKGVILGGGGTYELVHNTFGNFTPSFFQNEPSFYFSDSINFEQKVFEGHTEVILTNNILWGDLYEEISISEKSPKQLMISGSHNIIQTRLEKIGNLENTIVEHPMFTQNIYSLDFRLEAESPAIDAAIQTPYVLDYYGKERNTTPDIGAIEWFEIPTEEEINN